MLYNISWRVRSSFIFAFDYLNQAENASCPLLKVVFMLRLPFLNRYTRLIYTIVFIGNVYFLYPVGTVVEFQYQYSIWC